MSIRPVGHVIIFYVLFSVIGRFKGDLLTLLVCLDCIKNSLSLLMKSIM